MRSRSEPGLPRPSRGSFPPPQALGSRQRRWGRLSGLRARGGLAGALCGLLLVSAALGRSPSPPGPAPGASSVPVLELPASGERVSLAGYAQVFEDPTGTMTLAEVRARADALFGPATTFNFGMNRRPHWLRFRVRQVDPQGRWLLDVGYPALDEVTLYVPEAGAPGGYRAYTAGDRVPSSQQASQTAYLAFPLPEAALAGEPLYLRVETTGQMGFPLSVVTERPFLRFVTASYLFHGFVGGVLLVMILYNLMLFVGLRERAYLYYVLYMSMLLAYVSTLSVFVHQFFPGDVPGHFSRVTLSFMNASTFFVVHFARTFLDLPETHPRLNRWLRGYALLFVAQAVLLVVGPYRLAAATTVLLGSINSPLMLIVGLESLRRGNRSARYFLAAWGAYLAIATLMTLDYAGLRPVPGLTTIQLNYLFFVASCAEAVLLSLGLADRIRRIEEAREAEKAALRHRIADDLHDDLGSRLSALALRLEMTGRTARLGPAERDVLTRTAGQARALVGDLRDTIWLVDPARDDLPGLVARLAATSDELLAGRAHRLHLPDVLPPLPVGPDVRRAVLMMLKEALHNALRHAAAPHIDVRIAYAAGQLEVHVADDGRGFDPEAVRPGRGTHTMERRARALGGDVQIRSHPGGGTSVHLRVPVAGRGASAS